MQKFILKNNKVVELNLAPIEEALKLYRIVVYECKGCGLDLTIAEETTIADLFNKNIDAILSVLSSENVFECLKDCAKYVLYNKQKFDLSLFEDIKNRADLMPVLHLVAIENLRYFFAEAHIVFDFVLSQIVK